MTLPASNPSRQQDAVHEVRKALMALRLEVPAKVADDVSARVERLLDENERLETRVQELGKSVETWTAFGEGIEARVRELESALERIDALTRLTADTRAGNAVRELGDIARTALAAGGRSPVGADGEQEA